MRRGVGWRSLERSGRSGIGPRLCWRRGLKRGCRQVLFGCMMDEDRNLLDLPMNYFSIKEGSRLGFDRRTIGDELAKNKIFDTLIHFIVVFDTEKYPGENAAIIYNPPYTSLRLSRLDVLGRDERHLGNRRLASLTADLDTQLGARLVQAILNVAHGNVLLQRRAGAA